MPVVVAINARIADGKDPSWLWDVPFERLQGRLVVATGERSADLAVRLRYADVDHRRQPDLLQAIGEAGADRVDVVANYTTFQAINRPAAPMAPEPPAAPSAVAGGAGFPRPARYLR